MRILHILDHSLPLQSGYVYRTLGIVNQQRALGWEPVLLTSGKHYAPGPPRERIGEWEFLRTPAPNGVGGRLPWVRELKIVGDLGRRLDEVIDEVRPDLPARALPGAERDGGGIRAGGRHRLPVIYEVRALWEDAAASHRGQRAPDLRYRATRLIETRALRRADALTTICDGLRREMIGRGISPEKPPRQGASSSARQPPAAWSYVSPVTRSMPRITSGSAACPGCCQDSSPRIASMTSAAAAGPKRECPPALSQGADVAERLAHRLGGLGA